MSLEADAASVTRAAPAKLNLYLHVTGKRADGFHLLDSLIAFADLGDTVSVSESDSLSLESTGPFAGSLPESGGNIVLKAAGLLRESAGVTAGARIKLTKRLPVASGIGGGSADAAAALRALASLWRVRASEDDLAALALALGADVPICLYGRGAFVGGIGEKIVAAPKLPAAWLVLANPGVAVSTGDVFAARPPQYGDAARFTKAPKNVAELAALLAERRNDLAATAMNLYPEISRAVGALTRSPGCKLARMSGSGATCFGLYSGEEPARRAAGDLAAAEPGWWVAAARLVNDTADLADA